MSYLQEVLSSRELLANLTLREVRGKYKRTIFGQLWSLANPLAAMVIYTFVFAFIFRVKPDAGNPSGLDIFALWLLCALLPWTFFTSVVNTGMGVLLTNAGLVQKVYFSRIVLPLSVVGSIAFSWLFEMGVLVLAIVLVGGWQVVLWLPAIVLVMALLAVFASGIAFMLSVANVHFRDTQYFMSIILQMWMYLTPIVYPLSLVSDQSDRIGGLLGTDITLTDIYRLNPMERFVQVFRSLMYDQTWPALDNVLYIVVVSVLVFLLGLWVFRRNEKGLAEAL